MTQAELDAFFERADSDGLGFLSLDDARGDLRPAAAAAANARVMKAGSPACPAEVDAGQGAVSARRSARSSPAPTLDEAAPDFTLKTVDGKEEVTLSKLVGPKPVVLIFGNFTCGPFRSQSGNVREALPSATRTAPRS